MIRKRIGLPENTNPWAKLKMKTFESAKAQSDVEELPESLFVEPIILNESMSVECKSPICNNAR